MANKDSGRILCVLSRTDPFTFLWTKFSTCRALWKVTVMQCSISIWLCERTSICEIDWLIIHVNFGLYCLLIFKFSILVTQYIFLYAVQLIDLRWDLFFLLSVCRSLLHNTNKRIPFPSHYQTNTSDIQGRRHQGCQLLPIWVKDDLSRGKAAEQWPDASAGSAHQIVSLSEMCGLNRRIKSLKLQGSVVLDE